MVKEMYPYFVVRAAIADIQLGMVQRFETLGSAKKITLKSQRL
jgi:hypothetical protein